MFKIIKDGEVIAITEKLNFVKQSASGVFVGCTEEEAQGVAVKNTAYNLAGRNEMNGCETVVVFEIDSGAQMEEHETNVTELEALIVEHEYKLALMEAGVK